MHADIKLGYACNNNCRHCVIADQRDRARVLRGNTNRGTEEYISEIVDCINRGCNSVTLTGGEPTIRKDLFEICDFLKKSQIRISLQTNGRMFYYYDFAKKSVSYIDYYVIAVHGSNAEIHDAITSSPGSFDQTITGIRNLVSLGARICGKVVLSNHNYKDLVNLVRMLKNLKVDNILVAFPHANGNAYKYFDEVVPNYSDIKPYLQETIEKYGDLDLGFEAVLPCCLDKPYDKKYFIDLAVAQEGYTELKQLDSDVMNWNERRKQIKTKFPICKDCKYGAYCEGYWYEYPEKRGIDEFSLKFMGK